MKKFLLSCLAATVSFSAILSKPAQADEPKPAPAPKEEPKVKPYPLDTCVVSDEKLGSMGKPMVLVHEGQEIKFCCKACKPKFEKDPAKFLKKLTKTK